MTNSCQGEELAVVKVVQIFLATRTGRLYLNV